MPRSAKLTKTVIDATVAEAVRTDRRLSVFDTACGGFYVQCYPTGKASFRLVYREGGGGRAARQRTLTIGDFPTLTVDQARKVAIAHRASVLAGADPLQQRQDKRTAPRMRESFPEWIKDVERRAKEASVKEYRRMWTREIEPVLGDARVTDVSEADIRSLHRAMANRPFMANRVRGRLFTFFSWCESEGIRPRHSNPVTVTPYPERKKERYLKQDEIAALLDALDRAERVGLPSAPEIQSRKGGSTEGRASRAREGARPYKMKQPRGKRGPYTHVAEPTPTPANPSAVAAIRLLLLTGMREQEALSLRWEDVDKEAKLVHLRDTKTGDSIRPLSDAALEIITKQPTVKDNPYVFPGRKPGTHLKEVRSVWCNARYAAGLGATRLHDLRHTMASTLINKAGLSLPVVGGVLGHRDVKSTARYAHLAQDTVRAAANAAARSMLPNSTSEVGAEGKQPELMEQSGV